MDKNLEYQYLSQVFGSSRAGQFVPGERPDFTLTLSDDLVLGVETTSIFASNAAAKLARRHEYYDALLQDRSRLHRKDRGQVDVLENATLRFGEEEVTTNLLRYEVPSMIEMLERLKELLVSKSLKLAEYSKRCRAVDLIIADEQGTLYWQQPAHFRAWLSHFLPRAAVQEAGFREIYLTIPTLELGEVSVALKGSLFTSDVHALINLVRDSPQPMAVLCACLSRSGYGDARVSMLDEVCFFRRGAWVVEHRGGSFTARDLRLDLRNDPHPTLEQLDAQFPAAVKVQAEHFVAKRQETLGGAGLLLVDEASEGLRRSTRRSNRPDDGGVEPDYIAPPRLKLWAGKATPARGREGTVSSAEG